MYDNIEQAISNFNLIEYVQLHGYKNISPLTANYVKFKGELGDTIVIKKRGEFLFKGAKLPCQWYSNVNGINQDRGTVFNFIANRINGGIVATQNFTQEERNKIYNCIRQEIGEVVSDGYNTIHLDRKEHYGVTEEQLTQKIAILENYGKRTIDYLKEYRRISAHILQRPEFAGIIKEMPFELPNKHIIKNLTFIKRDINDNIKGLVTHYYSSKEARNAKRVFETSSKGILRSNILPNCQGLFVGESIIDCLSHLQLFEKNVDESKRFFTYASFEGSPSQKEITEMAKIYKKIVAQNQNDKSKVFIYSITDNDLQGYLYDNDLAIKLHNIENPDNKIQELQANDMRKFVFENTKLKEKGTEIADKIKEQILIENPNSKEFADKVSFVQEEKNAVMYLPIPFEKEAKKEHYKYLNVLTSFIYEKAGVPFKLHKSSLKDWNDELKYKIIQQAKKNSNLNTKPIQKNIQNIKNKI